MTREDVLRRNRFMVEEHSSVWQAAFRFDVRDPDTGEILLQCRETPSRGITRLLRFSEYKRTTPFDLHVYSPDERLLMRIARGVPIFSSRVAVYDIEDRLVGTFRQKVFSLASSFDVLDARGRPVCQLKGRPARASFEFQTREGSSLARVSKQWAGMAKELFTSADHYLLEIDPAVPTDPTLRRLILASALCIGLVVKFELP